MNNSQTDFKKYLFLGSILTILLILWIGFYRLQISESTIYSQKSLQNSVRMITRMPVRGNIYDRDGRLIVDNRPAFSLYLIPAEVNDHTLAVISELAGLPQSEIRKKLKGAGRFQPVKIVRQVDMRTLAWIQENILDLPGIEWKIEPKRHYVRHSGLAHLLGTLGEVDDKELKRFPDLEAGDVVGKKALERKYDKILRGRKGVKFVKVDAMGRMVEEVTSDKSARPYPGEQLFLTIDLRLQAWADSLLTGKRGALVAIDPRSGEVLTLLSKPDYDLSYFTGIVPTNVWNKLLNDPHHPLYDRAYQSSYPPGSIYKLVAAIAALNEKIITPAWTTNCPGYFKLGRRTIRCWKPDGHGQQDLIHAIKNSCNVYFYKLGLLIGIDTWHKYSLMFHFGQKTGIELTNENPGLVPSRQWYEKVYGRGKWTRGMLANLAIGQGELLVTPLQMAQFVSILAERGKLYKPHLGLKLYDPITQKTTVIPRQEEDVPGIDSTVYKYILQGMREVVDGGTGWRAGIYGIPVAGKTGTAQNPHGDPHAWFIGFAPFDHPEIAVCVLVENGGSGGAVAAPIAGAYMKRYFYYHGKYDYRIERRLLAEKKKQDSTAAALRRHAAEPDTTSNE